MSGSSNGAQHPDPANTSIMDYVMNHREKPYTLKAIVLNGSWKIRVPVAIWAHKLSTAQCMLPGDKDILLDDAAYLHRASAEKPARLLITAFCGHWRHAEKLGNAAGDCYAGVVALKNGDPEPC